LHLDGMRALRRNTVLLSAAGSVNVLPLREAAAAMIGLLRRRRTAASAAVVVAGRGCAPPTRING
jgi:hypothetical protein